MSTRVLMEKGIGTVYVFENRYVVHVKKDSAIRGIEATGELHTGQITLKYIIKNLDGARSMLLIDTNKGYAIGILPGEISALKQAILYIAEREKLRVIQSRRKPDYGFELLTIQVGQLTSTANLSQSKKIGIIRSNIHGYLARHL